MMEMSYVLIRMVFTDVYIFQNPSICAIEVCTLSYAHHTLLKRGGGSLKSSGGVCCLLGLQGGVPRGMVGDEARQEVEGQQVLCRPC